MTATIKPTDLPPIKGTLHIVSIESVGSTFRVHAQCTCGAMWSYKPSDWRKKDAMSKCRNCNTKLAKKFTLGPKRDVWPDGGWRR